jgi:hypothetical protein
VVNVEIRPTATSVFSSAFSPLPLCVKAATVRSIRSPRKERERIKRDLSYLYLTKIGGTPIRRKGRLLIGRKKPNLTHFPLIPHFAALVALDPTRSSLGRWRSRNV